MIQKLIDQGFSKHEATIIEWQYQYAGNFQENLLNLIRRADEGNRRKLAKGFPDEVLAIKLYLEEPGWWTKVQQEYLDKVVKDGVRY